MRLMLACLFPHWIGALMGGRDVPWNRQIKAQIAINSGG